MRGSFDDALAAARSLAGRGTRPRQLPQSVPDRGPEDGGLRDPRRARRRTEVLALPYGGGGNTCAYAKGFVEADAGLPCILAAQSSSAHARSRRRSASRRPCMRSRSRRRWRERRAESCPSPTMPSSRPGDSWPTRRVLRYRLRGFPRRARRIRPRARHPGRVRDHGPWAERPRDRRAPDTVADRRRAGPRRNRCRRPVRIRVRAPASTANVGPGFDCVAVALDLWNRLEVEDGDGGSISTTSASAPLRSWPPLRVGASAGSTASPERGLGSSASVIALGLVAAAHSLSAASPIPRSSYPRASVPRATPTTWPPRSRAASASRGRGASHASPAAFRQCRSRSFRRRPCRPRCPAPAFPPRSRTGMPPSLRLVLHAPRRCTVERLARVVLERCRIDCTSRARTERASPHGSPRKPPCRGSWRHPVGAPGPPSSCGRARMQRTECAHALGRRFPGERVVPLAVSQAGAGRTDE